MSVCSRSNWNLEVLVFKEKLKPEYPEKNLQEQGREPTANSTHIWCRRHDSNTGHIGGRRVLSPLRHSCFAKKKWLLQSDPDEKYHQLGCNIQATINNLSLITSQEKLYTCVCIWSRSKPASGASWPFISWEVRSSATKTSRSFSKTYRANNHKNNQMNHRKIHQYRERQPADRTSCFVLEWGREKKPEHLDQSILFCLVKLVFRVRASVF